MKKTALLILSLFACGFAQAQSVRETPVVRVVRDWSDSVVNISTERISLIKNNPVWRRMDQVWNESPATIYGVKTKSLGSGVVVRADGVIATNAHVVQMASKIYVLFRNGKTAEARLLGTDNSSDLALIAVDLPYALKPVALAEDTLIGETVITVGNPFGLQNSVSEGIISATGRTFTTNPPDLSYRDLIQTDAAMHPGSSGGALLNLEGKLTGINLALFQGATDISFAIPSYKIRKMLAEYDRIQSVVRPADAPAKK